jgi:erythrocyte band 7 integral membrane protein
MGAIPCCVVCPNPYKSVHQGNVGLVTKFGRFYRAVDPGLVRINPLSEKLIQVDVKIQIVGMFLQSSPLRFIFPTSTRVHGLSHS